MGKDAHITMDAGMFLNENDTQLRCTEHLQRIEIGACDLVPEAD